jgi:hypothetical protein
MDIIGRRPRDGTSLKLRRSIEIRPLLSNLLEENTKIIRKSCNSFWWSSQIVSVKPCIFIEGLNPLPGCVLVVKGHTQFRTGQWHSRLMASA